MKALRELNPDARYLRDRIRSLAWLYALAALAATGLGLALSPVHTGLTDYEPDVEISPELAALLEAADPAAVDRAPVECFHVYVVGEWRVDRKPALLPDAAEAMLVERLSPDRLESEMREALIVGSLNERRRVMAVLERHPGEATARLLKIASRDLDPELAARARELIRLQRP